MQKSMTVVLTLSLLSTSALAQQMYQWTDDSGVVQYGQLPPTGNHYQQITVQPSPPPGGQLRAPTPLPSKADTSADTAAAQRRRQRAETEQHLAVCERIRSNLNAMLNNPRLRRTNPAGEVERIGEDERQLMIVQAQESLRLDCQNQS